MDLKIEQYKKGERFVRAIADAGGPDALARLWEGPETLPRDGEIDAPERWIARVLDGPDDASRPTAASTTGPAPAPDPAAPRRRSP